MASATTQPAQIEAVVSSNPLVLWHLLSLDAPTVAALWTWFIAHANGAHLTAIPVAAMFLAVWVLYAADRLLDARALRREWSPDTVALSPALEARHLFHHIHRARFLALACVAALGLAALLPLLNHTAIRLFAAEGLILAAWFFTLHATRFARYLPKELALGLFFSAAVFIPTVARMHGVSLHLLIPALLFALLCSLNCLFIYRWEFSPYTEPGHPATHFAARYAPIVAAVLAAACLALTLAPGPLSRPVPAALALSALALLLLDRVRVRLTRTTLRAAADLALLTPLLVLIAAR